MSDQGECSDSPECLNLRAQLQDGPPGRDEKRFDIFLVDSCWNAPVSRMVRDNLPLIHQLQPQDTLYILSKQQSLEVLRYAHDLIGRDPILLVYDSYADDAKDSERYRGFRLCLGLFRHPEQASARLQEFLRFVAEHRAARCFQCEMRRELHREGFEGVIKVLNETSVEFLV